MPTLLEATAHAPGTQPLSADWRAHLTTLRDCRACPRVVPPPVTNAVPGAAIYLLGQAPGPKEQAQQAPFVGMAGRTLFRWFGTLGVDEAHFRARVYMGAVARCFPGKTPGQQGDRRPAPEEIVACAPFRLREFELLRPRLVIPVGKMAIDLLLDAPRLDDVVGRAFPLAGGAPGSVVIPLPHPSGLNRWIQKDPGKSLLAQGLRMIGESGVWKSEFGG